jgi:tetratricopeptide (TPR) repeat protein
MLTYLDTSAHFLMKGLDEFEKRNYYLASLYLGIDSSRYPRVFHSAYYLGRCFQKMGHYAEALVEMERAVHLAPQEARARYWYGVLLGETGRTEEALRQAQIAHTLEPHVVAYAVEVSVLLGRLGRRRAGNSWWRDIKRRREQRPDGEGEFLAISWYARMRAWLVRGFLTLLQRYRERRPLPPAYRPRRPA